MNSWNLKITCLKRKFIFQIFIFWFHVNFQDCNYFSFGIRAVLRGELAVSFREGISSPDFKVNQNRNRSGWLFAMFWYGLPNPLPLTLCPGTYEALRTYNQYNKIQKYDRNTVDGKNPAPLWMFFRPFFIDGIFTISTGWPDFVHQQYEIFRQTNI